MRIIRSVLIGALALTMALSLCACGTSSASTSSSSAAVSSQEAEQSISGTVLTVGGTSIVMRDIQGQQLSFIANEDQIANDLQLGDPVVVYYTGEIQDGNTSDTAVTRIERGEGDNLLANAEYVTGTVDDASMNGLTLKTEDGTMELSTSDDTIYVLKDGLTLDIQVTVGYDKDTNTALYIADAE